MNCSSCKNPVQENATECEWCGGKINSSYKVSDIARGKVIDPFITISWLILIPSCLLTFGAFYRIEIMKNGDSNDLYNSAWFILIGLLGLYFNRKR
jgi:hypothetical protein